MTDGGMSYTLDDYRAFVEDLLEDGYRFQGFEPLAERAIVVRHDVDLSPDAALAMAEVEASVGVTSTYCFLLTTPAYNLLGHVGTLEEIEELGHDVALHFDTHFYWDSFPGEESLEATVATELRTLERLIDGPVDTASFHRPPEWVLGVDFAGFENAYQPRFFGDIEYVSDSRQKWRTESPFGGERPPRAQILVHPGLWTPEDHKMATLMEELDRECRRRIDDYLEPYGEA